MWILGTQIGQLFFAINLVYERQTPFKMSLCSGTLCQTPRAWLKARPKMKSPDNSHPRLEAP